MSLVELKCFKTLRTNSLFDLLFNVALNILYLMIRMLRI